MKQNFALDTFRSNDEAKRSKTSPFIDPTPYQPDQLLKIRNEIMHKYQRSSQSQLKNLITAAAKIKTTKQVQSKGKENLKKTEVPYKENIQPRKQTLHQKISKNSSVPQLFESPAKPHIPRLSLEKIQQPEVFYSIEAKKIVVDIDLLPEF